jgi:DNA-binding XRE family transcriptional regulator
MRTRRRPPHHGGGDVDVEAVVPLLEAVEEAVAELRMAVYGGHSAGQRRPGTRATTEAVRRASADIDSVLQLGQVIRKRRRDLDMTQAALAKQLGVAAVTVSHWERGGSSPSVDKLGRIARALDVDPRSFWSSGDDQ